VGFRHFSPVVVSMTTLGMSGQPDSAVLRLFYYNETVNDRPAGVGKADFSPGGQAVDGTSVGRGPFRCIDDERIHGPLGRLQFQAKLLLNRLKEG
jgi:hypothetical protein